MFERHKGLIFWGHIFLFNQNPKKSGYFFYKKTGMPIFLGLKFFMMEKVTLSRNFQ